jgi:N-acetylmuramoyl-L-alanine amidase
VRAARPVLLCAVALAATACSVTPLHSEPRPVPAANSQVNPVAPAATAAPAPARPPVVVLDAGHNGGNAAHPDEIRRQVPDGRGGTKECNTTGTSTDAGYPEHAFTFDVTARAAQALTAAGVRVVLTRTDDTGVGPCVDVRGRAAEDDDADLMVSVHADGAAPSGTGFHVALPDPPLNPAQDAPSKALAAALRDALQGGGFPDSNYLGDQGLSPRTDLAGLNLATRPVALVECANMRNPAEAAVVSSPEGRQRYADAITAGILRYLGHP